MYNNNSSNPTVTYCTFSGNTTTFDAGGMYNFESSPTVTHCTFSGNFANLISGGGMINSGTSNPTLANCILWGDSPDEIVGGTPIVTFSDVQGGGFGGTGNIDANPSFVDADGPDNPTEAELARQEGRDYEPASVLLERIKAERAVTNAAIINVPGGQPTIQAGINAANPGDVVIVAQGEYFGNNINFNGKAITVRSTDPNGESAVCTECGGALQSDVRVAP